MKLVKEHMEIVSIGMLLFTQDKGCLIATIDYSICWNLVFLIEQTQQSGEPINNMHHFI